MSKIYLSLVFAFAFFSRLSTTIAAETPAEGSVVTSKFSLDVNLAARSRAIAEMSQLETRLKEDICRQALLQPRVYSDERLLFIHLKLQDGNGEMGWSHFQCGYGDIFPVNTIVTTSSNGAGWEVPNCVYVKYCRSF